VREYVEGRGGYRLKALPVGPMRRNQPTELEDLWSPPVLPSREGGWKILRGGRLLAARALSKTHSNYSIASTGIVYFATLASPNRLR
jgi:hypothetical protein